MPAWADYFEVLKDNPSDYERAFTQMVYALKYLRGETESFVKDTYDTSVMEKYGDRIRTIIRKRQINACEDWKKFGEELSGETIEEFDLTKYEDEYDLIPADSKNKSFIGKFIEGALQQKGMVTDEISKAGISHCLLRFHHRDLLLL